MRTHLEFFSDQFEIVEGEDEETNPGVFGLKPSEFLSEHLQALGYENEVIAEDWGRCILLKNSDFMSFVGCSAYGDDIWLIQIAPSKPYVRRWFKKIHAEPWVDKLATTVEQILLSHGGAQNLRWWSDEESGRK